MCHLATHTHPNPSDIIMTYWHRLAPFDAQLNRSHIKKDEGGRRTRLLQLIFVYSLTINHPLISISTIYPLVCNKGPGNALRIRYGCDRNPGAIAMGVFYGCDYGFGFDRNLLKAFPARDKPATGSHTSMS